MNIHFTDQTIFESLLSSAIVQIEFGSFLYGLKDRNSDTDILVIYSPSHQEQLSPFTSNYQFQYKDIDNNIDYIFTTPQNFIKNLMSGDSTINYEVIYDDVIKNTPILSFLYEMKESFNTYNVVKSYLGMARRDLNSVNKEGSDRDKNKRIIHAYRGLQSAKNVLSNSYVNKMLLHRITKCNEIKAIKSYKERDFICNTIMTDIDAMRSFTNETLQSGFLTRFMKPKDQRAIDVGMFVFYQSEYYNLKRAKYFPELFKMVYSANEIGITY